MNYDKYYKTLGFNNIKDTLATLTKTDFARNKALSLLPFLREIDVKLALSETNSAKIMIDMLGVPTIPSVDEVKNNLDLIEKEGILYPNQLEEIMTFIASCKRLKSYLEKGKCTNQSMAFMSDSISIFDEIYDEINNSISGQEIDSNASTQLKNIRRKIDNTNMQIQNKMEEILKAKKSYCSDFVITKKNGRFTIPIKKEYKNMLPGSVIAMSNTGATLFIEPNSVNKLTTLLDSLLIEENSEIEQILYTIASCISLYTDEFYTNISLIETLDFAFAKGKLSVEMNACIPIVTTARNIDIIQGRHPQIAQKDCVPIDIKLGDGIRGIIITGPNTGGKTATLKLVGLFSLMAQSGLHLPAKTATLSMNNNVLCDIGDGQNITQNLSTFSSHILNVIEILNATNKDTLVILDELGSGTDPTEGTGIAISILEELRNRNCLILATTHYEKVKEYTKNAEGLINARMTFDRESLKPNYQLVIGEAGESCALHIAKKLGFPDHLLKHAFYESYGDNGDNDFVSKLSNSDIKKSKITAPKIEKIKAKNKQSERALSFNRGDSVFILPEKTIGIVFKSCDDMGNIGVQIRGEKLTINHKRLQLNVKASELYPDDYDFSIIFNSVEFRKANKLMGKRHVDGLIIEHED